MSHEHYEVAHHQSKTVDQWKSITATVTTIWALMIAISSFGIENANHHSLLLKNEAVDQWTFFQAKSLKKKLFELESENLSFTKTSDPHFEEKAYLSQEYKNTIERYEKEEEEIMQQAKEFNKESEHYDKKGNFFEVAQVFFEIAIVLSAVFLLSDRRFLFYLGVGSGGIGIVVLGLGVFY